MLSVFRCTVAVVILAVAYHAKAGESIMAANTTAPPGYNTKYTLHKSISFFYRSDPFDANDSSSFVIPFTRAGNLILIQAKADTLDGNFILDTGAPKLVLNTTYFRDYHSIADLNTNEESGGITGSTGNEGAIKINEFSIGPFKYYQEEADRVNLGHIEDSKGIKILGLLGMQLFRRFEMIIDYEKGLLHLHLISKKEGASYKNEMLNDTSAYNTYPIMLTEDKIMTYIEVAGKKLTFIIDTGAESNVLDSRLPDKIFENVTITRKVVLTGSGNAKIDALYGDMKNTRIGNRDIINLPVLVTNLERMCKSYERCLDGMLGFDFLSLHKIGFNFVTRKMYIWK